MYASPRLSQVLKDSGNKSCVDFKDFERRLEAFRLEKAVTNRVDGPFDSARVVCVGKRSEGLLGLFLAPVQQIYRGARDLEPDTGFTFNQDRNDAALVVSSATAAATAASAIASTSAKPENDPSPSRI